MLPLEPLALTNSWPLFERDRRFALGTCFDALPGSDAPAFDPDRLSGAGRWSCDLSDQSLAWTDPVYDLFGLPRGAQISRRQSVALYAEGSRAKMERLRAYAIRHRRGFTLDVELRPATGGTRWMRLIAAPVCRGREVIRLEGLKLALD